MKLASSCVLVYMVASRIRSLIQAVSTAAGVTSPFLKEADSFVHALSGSDEVSQPTVGCWRVTGSLLKASFKNPAPCRDYDMATPSNTPYLSPSGDNGKGTRQYSTFSQPKRHDQLHLSLGHSVIRYTSPDKLLAVREELQGRTTHRRIGLSLIATGTWDLGSPHWLCICGCGCRCRYCS